MSHTIRTFANGRYIYGFYEPNIRPRGFVWKICCISMLLILCLFSSVTSSYVGLSSGYEYYLPISAYSTTSFNRTLTFSFSGYSTVTTIALSVHSQVFLTIADLPTGWTSTTVKPAQYTTTGSDYSPVLFAIDLTQASITETVVVTIFITSTPTVQPLVISYYNSAGALITSPMAAITFRSVTAVQYYQGPSIKTVVQSSSLTTIYVNDYQMDAHIKLFVSTIDNTTISNIAFTSESSVQGCTITMVTSMIGATIDCSVTTASFLPSFSLDVTTIPTSSSPSGYMVILYDLWADIQTDLIDFTPGYGQNDTDVGLYYDFIWQNDSLLTTSQSLQSTTPLTTNTPIASSIGRTFAYFTGLFYPPLESDDPSAQTTISFCFIPYTTLTSTTIPLTTATSWNTSSFSSLLFSNMSVQATDQILPRYPAPSTSSVFPLTFDITVPNGLSSQIPLTYQLPMRFEATSIAGMYSSLAVGTKTISTTLSTLMSNILTNNLPSSWLQYTSYSVISSWVQWSSFSPSNYDPSSSTSTVSTLTSPTPTLPYSTSYLTDVTQALYSNPSRLLDHLPPPISSLFPYSPLGLFDFYQYNPGISTTSSSASKSATTNVLFNWQAPSTLPPAFTLSFATIDTNATIIALDTTSNALLHCEYSIIYPANTSTQFDEESSHTIYPCDITSLGSICTFTASTASVSCSFNISTLSSVTLQPNAQFYNLNVWFPLNVQWPTVSSYQTSPLLSSLSFEIISGLSSLATFTQTIPLVLYPQISFSPFNLTTTLPSTGYSPSSQVPFISIPIALVPNAFSTAQSVLLPNSTFSVTISPPDITFIPYIAPHTALLTSSTVDYSELFAQAFNFSIDDTTNGVALSVDSSSGNITYSFTVPTIIASYNITQLTQSTSIFSVDVPIVFSPQGFSAWRRCVELLSISTFDPNDSPNYTAEWVSYSPLLSNSCATQLSLTFSRTLFDATTLDSTLTYLNTTTTQYAPPILQAADCSGTYTIYGSCEAIPNAASVCFIPGTDWSKIANPFAALSSSSLTSTSCPCLSAYSGTYCDINWSTTSDPQFNLLIQPNSTTSIITLAPNDSQTVPSQSSSFSLALSASFTTFPALEAKYSFAISFSSSLPGIQSSSNIVTTVPAGIYWVFLPSPSSSSSSSSSSYSVPTEYPAWLVQWQNTTFSLSSIFLLPFSFSPSLSDPSTQQNIVRLHLSSKTSYSFSFYVLSSPFSQPVFSFVENSTALTLSGEKVISWSISTSINSTSIDGCDIAENSGVQCVFATNSSSIVQFPSPSAVLTSYAAAVSLSSSECDAILTPNGNLVAYSSQYANICLSSRVGSVLSTVAIVDNVEVHVCTCQCSGSWSSNIENGTESSSSSSLTYCTHCSLACPGLLTPSSDCVTCQCTSQLCLASLSQIYSAIYLPKNVLNLLWMQNGITQETISALFTTNSSSIVPNSHVTRVSTADISIYNAMYSALEAYILNLFQSYRVSLQQIVDSTSSTSSSTVYDDDTITNAQNILNQWTSTVTNVTIVPLANNPHILKLVYTILSDTTAVDVNNITQTLPSIPNFSSSVSQFFSAYLISNHASLSSQSIASFVTLLKSLLTPVIYAPTTFWHSDTITTQCLPRQQYLELQDIIATNTSISSIDVLVTSDMLSTCPSVYDFIENDNLQANQTLLEQLNPLWKLTSSLDVIQYQSLLSTTSLASLQNSSITVFSLLTYCFDFSGINLALYDVICTNDNVLLYDVSSQQLLNNFYLQPIFDHLDVSQLAIADDILDLIYTWRNVTLPSFPSFPHVSHIIYRIETASSSSSSVTSSSQSLPAPASLFSATSQFNSCNATSFGDQCQFSFSFAPELIITEPSLLTPEQRLFMSWSYSGTDTIGTLFTLSPQLSSDLVIAAADNLFDDSDDEVSDSDNFDVFHEQITTVPSLTALVTSVNSSSTFWWSQQIATSIASTRSSIVLLPSYQSSLLFRYIYGTTPDITSCHTFTQENSSATLLSPCVFSEDDTTSSTNTASLFSLYNTSAVQLSAYMTSLPQYSVQNTSLSSLLFPDLCSTSSSCIDPATQTCNPGLGQCICSFGYLPFQASFPSIPHPTGTFYNQSTQSSWITEPSDVITPPSSLSPMFFDPRIDTVLQLAAQYIENNATFHSDGSNLTCVPICHNNGTYLGQYLHPCDCSTTFVTTSGPFCENILPCNTQSSYGNYTSLNITNVLSDVCGNGALQYINGYQTALDLFLSPNLTQSFPALLSFDDVSWTASATTCGSSCQCQGFWGTKAMSPKIMQAISASIDISNQLDYVTHVFDTDNTTISYLPCSYCTLTPWNIAFNNIDTELSSFVETSSTQTYVTHPNEQQRCYIQGTNPISYENGFCTQCLCRPGYSGTWCHLHTIYLGLIYSNDTQYAFSYANQQLLYTNLVHVASIAWYGYNESLISIAYHNASAHRIVFGIQTGIDFFQLNRQTHQQQFTIPQSTSNAVDSRAARTRFSFQNPYFSPSAVNVSPNPSTSFDPSAQYVDSSLASHLDLIYSTLSIAQNNLNTSLLSVTDPAQFLNGFTVFDSEPYDPACIANNLTSSCATGANPIVNATSNPFAISGSTTSTTAIVVGVVVSVGCVGGVSVILILLYCASQRQILCFKPRPIKRREDVTHSETRSIGDSRFLSTQTDGMSTTAISESQPGSQIHHRGRPFPTRAHTVTTELTHTALSSTCTVSLPPTSSKITSIRRITTTNGALNNRGGAPSNRDQDTTAATQSIFTPSVSPSSSASTSTSQNILPFDDPTLSPEWQAYRTSTGVVFYVNNHSMQSQWEHPFGIEFQTDGVTPIFQPQISLASTLSSHTSESIHLNTDYSASYTQQSSKYPNSANH